MSDSHEYDQGYRDQAAWLRKQAPSLPGAEHCLSQRQATHDGGEYNRGGDQATADCIGAMRHRLADMHRVAQSAATGKDCR